MDDEIDVDPALLERDALDGWQDWSGDLKAMKDKVPLDIPAEAFSSIPGAQAIYAKWVQSAKALQEYLGTGEEVFEGFARTLLETAKDYMEAEDYAQSEIDRVQRELESL